MSAATHIQGMCVCAELHKPAVLAQAVEQRAVNDKHLTHDKMSVFKMQTAAVLGHVSAAKLLHSVTGVIISHCQEEHHGFLQLNNGHH